MNFTARYKKHIMLPEIGVNGQNKLFKSSILIIGCGGLASSVIPFIASSGIGEVILIDDDIIELSNLNRQIIYKTSDINQQKVIKAKEFINSLNPDINVNVLFSRINQNNFEEVFNKVDLIVDCTDRLAVKLFIHDACLLIGKPLVYSTAIGFVGQVLTILPKGKPCLRCFFENQYMNLKLNCANSAVFAPILGVIGSIVATEAIKYFLNISPNLVGRFQVINLKTNEFNVYKFTKSQHCIACSDNSKIDPYDIDNYESKLHF